ncbi:TetR/AcrR family transcriptional regulator [Streptomyces sp. TLI_171]|uniref:TetR/AcrR family transcriptional regulator n=1 Tax=Streptomyces sp. TLI_171 TaxID=1938859 RepID=UPI000C195F85|nr:TetR/AcrR family transcriptional regulator [Streptomyces sp. TLI_171]RKE18905.1 TetR family transcriptional regulator [Streptomyces sp. TLI_171]
MAERRRGAALEQALLDAAWAELTEHGYAGFTMDAVVKRAGTSPPVLYRRWPDRDALARAAIAHVLERARLEVPDTGSLREDVLALLRAINATRVELVALMSVQLAGYQRATGTAPAELLAAGGPDGTEAIFERAVARGEARPEKLSPRIRALPFDLLRQELLTTHAPVPDDVLAEIVDTVFLPLVR